MNRVVFSPAAKADLERIDRNTRERFGRSQAERMEKHFLSALETISAHPESAPLRPELDPPGRSLRHRVVRRRFIIAYEIFADRVRVVRVLDGRRRDLQGLLDEDGGDPEPGA